MKYTDKEKFVLCTGILYGMGISLIPIGLGQLFSSVQPPAIVWIFIGLLLISEGFLISKQKISHDVK